MIMYIQVYVMLQNIKTKWKQCVLMMCEDPISLYIILSVVQYIENDQQKTVYPGG